MPSSAGHAVRTLLEAWAEQIDRAQDADEDEDDDAPVARA
jgi:hypothetical protein